MHTQVQQALQELRRLWKQEQKTTHQQFLEERKLLTLEERVEQGLALRDLEVADVDYAPGRRTRLWLQVPDPRALEDLRISSGSPVRLWWDAPDSLSAVPATVARRSSEKLAVIIDGDPDERLENGTFHLDRDAPQHTFERGLRALDLFLGAASGSDAARLGAVLFGVREPEFAPKAPLRPLDPQLNGPQRQAVELALSARDVALIHGPPGTGKTRTLVEVIRQAVAQGQRVLATAASNTAVDNLAERLVEHQIKLVRLGHPARISATMEAHTMDAWLERSGVFKMTASWARDAATLRRKAARSQDKAQRRQFYREASDITRDVRDQIQRQQQRVLGQVQVICATAAGSDISMLEEESFDLVVLDEATQAPTPVALVPLSRAPRVVMAGDPHQLPPTVIDMEAAREGLQRTLFEELAPLRPEAVQMLTIQHRMHEDLMRFPSQSMYQGRLEASPAVARQTLEDLGIPTDSLRPGPLVFIDTAGRGWEEERRQDDPSTSNPGQAQRTSAEVLRLLGRGVPAQDIAVITPYHAQVRLLRELLRQPLAQGLDLGTVDSFQGREKEVILVDLVRSNERGELGFLQDTRRMNVALTRARRLLIVIGDSATIGAHPFYADFLAEVERQAGAWISAWSDEAPLWGDR